MIDGLEAASGQKVLGFRAPRFSLRAQDAGHFQVLERLFAYDSSVTVAGAAELAAFRRAAGVRSLALFPVARQKVLPGLPPLRSGGGYLRLLPAAVTRRGWRWPPPASSRWSISTLTSLSPTAPSHSPCAR